MAKSDIQIILEVRELMEQVRQAHEENNALIGTKDYDFRIKLRTEGAHKALKHVLLLLTTNNKLRVEERELRAKERRRKKG